MLKFGCHRLAECMAPPLPRILYFSQLYCVAAAVSLFTQDRVVFELLSSDSSDSLGPSYYSTPSRRCFLLAFCPSINLPLITVLGYQTDPRPAPGSFVIFFPARDVSRVLTLDLLCLPMIEFARSRAVERGLHLPAFLSSRSRVDTYGIHVSIDWAV